MEWNLSRININLMAPFGGRERAKDPFAVRQFFLLKIVVWKGPVSWLCIKGLCLELIDEQKPLNNF